MTRRRIPLTLFICWAFVLHLGIDGFLSGAAFFTTAARFSVETRADLSPDQVAWLKKRSDDRRRNGNRGGPFDDCPLCLATVSFVSFVPPNCSISILQPARRLSKRVAFPASVIVFDIARVSVARARAPPSA